MVRGALLIFGASAVLVVLAAGLAIRGQPSPTRGWQEFSIGPATGRNTSINQDGIRSDGAVLKTLRIIGPDWLASERYAIRAVIPQDSPEPLASLLQQELASRLNLAAHIEKREFDVFVLRAKKDAASQWQNAGRETRINVHDFDMQAREVTVGGFANALQNVLGRPVVDETGIPGNYTFEFPWGEDRVATVTAALENRFGLLLASERRSLDALIVDHAEMARLGRLPQWLTRFAR